MAGAVHGQQLDPVTKWATIAEYEFPLSMNISYQRANNIDLRLDVITAGPRSVSRPTLIYFHGGGWPEGSKDGVLLYMLPYLARGMNAVNVEYRMALEAADKAVNLVGCKSPHHQLPGQVVSISDACGGNEACSART